MHPLFVSFSHIITPLGPWFGVKEKKHVPAKPNPVLESFYKKNGFVNNNNNNIQVSADKCIRVNLKQLYCSAVANFI